MIPIWEMYRYVKRSYVSESEKQSKHWRLSVVQVRNFYYLLKVLVFWHEERETQFLLCWLFHLTPPRAAHLADPTGLAWVRISSRFVQLQIPTNCFFKNPLPIASGHDVIHIPNPISYPGFFIMTSVIVTSPRASVNTCAQCVLLPMH